jgi:hypothetical protein
MRIRISIAVALIVLTGACTSHRNAALPPATPEVFPDLGGVVEQAKKSASAAGDAHPHGAAIVKSSLAAVFGDVPGNESPDRHREIYFVRLDGDFHGCPRRCDSPGVPSSSTDQPTRWIGFDWDPVQHLVLDYSYGSAVHLEEFGTVYSLNLP